MDSGSPYALHSNRLAEYQQPRPREFLGHDGRETIVGRDPHVQNLMPMTKLLHGFEMSLEHCQILLQTGFIQCDPTLIVVFHIVQLATAKQTTGCKFACTEDMNGFDLIPARFE